MGFDLVEIFNGFVGICRRVPLPLLLLFVFTTIFGGVVMVDHLHNCSDFNALTLTSFTSLYSLPHQYLENHYYQKRATEP